MYRDDLTLLQRWRVQRDAEAFDMLVTRHAGMVYAACKRILRNASDAEDVTQECFLKLAQSGDSVTSSLGGWLHRIATRQSLNRLKQDKRRLSREQTFAAQHRNAEPTNWNDVQSYIDEGIEQLPEPTRDLVIAHFLNRQTHEAIAAERGIPRRTVSHRIERGVARVRAHLESRGIRIGATALAGTLAANAAEATPPTLTAALGRLAIAGVTSPAGTTTAKVLGGVLLMNAKLVGVIAGIVTIAAIGLLAYAPWDKSSPPKQIAEFDDTVNAPTAAPSEIENEPPEPTPTDFSVITPDIDSTAPTTSAPGWIADSDDAISVAGYVLDENGIAIPNALVEANAIGYGEIQDITDDFNAVLSARTDPSHKHSTHSNRDGEFTIEGIRHAGFIILSASHEGYISQQNESSMLNLDPGSAKRDVLIVLSRSNWTLKGRVVEQGSQKPVVDAQVISLGDWNTGSHTDSAGRFSMNFARAKNVPLHVVSDIHGRATFPEVFNGTQEIVTLEMPDPAIVIGHVTRDTAPAPAIQVKLEGKWVTNEYTVDNLTIGQSTGKGFSYTTQTNPDGSFQITGIDPGQEYEIYLLNEDHSPASSRDILGILQPGSETTWDHNLDNRMNVHGIVLGSQSGLPLQDIYVSALKDGLPMPSVGTYVDANGAYQLRLPEREGNYRIFPKYLHADDTDMSATFGKDAYLQPGESKQIDLALLDPWTIKARVVDSHGEPIHITYIMVREPNQSTQILRMSDSDGTISWTGIAPGAPTQIAVSALGHTEAETPTGVFAGEPGSVFDAGDLVLYKTSAGIEGTVSTATGEPLADTPIRITAHYGPDSSKLILSAHTNDQGEFIVMDGVPATQASFLLEAAGRDGIMVGETEYSSIVSDSITNIGRIVMR